MDRTLPSLSRWFLPSRQPERLCLGARHALGWGRVTLPLDEFNTHLYIVGQSGQGKSKLIQQLLSQLATTRWGCGVLDPHSDLATDLVAQLASYPVHKPWLSIPANRRRIVYVDPARSDYVVPTNILRNPYATPYEIAENVVEAFRRVWPQTLAEAPRFAQILRNAVLVLTQQKLSLLELEPLLTDIDFRTPLLSGPVDPQAIAFFQDQYSRWGRDQLLMAAPVLNKIAAFLFTPQVRCMLGASENRLDLRRILDDGQILIVDLGGFKDAETQRLLGSLLLTGLEQAAFSRRDLAPEERRPYLWVVDEFPLFCSRDQTSLARILSECRKYRLHLGLAHQTISQLPGERLQGALENAKLKVIFATGRETAQAVVGDLFIPDPRSVKHQVQDAEQQARSHPLYHPLAEQLEAFTQAIQRLGRRRVLVKLPDREGVLSLRTLTVPPPRVGRDELGQILTDLARQAGVPRREIEEEIVGRSGNHGRYRADPINSSPNPDNFHDEFWTPAPSAAQTTPV